MANGSFTVPVWVEITVDENHVLVFANGGLSGNFTLAAYAQYT